MRLNLRHFRLFLIALVSAALFGCAGKDVQQTEIQNITDAFEDAKLSIQRGNYSRGIQVFEVIQARYPFSDLARQIQLELMYAYYKSGRSEEAVEAADTFMRENPIHPRVDYALYIRGLAYYEKGPGILERWFNRDLTKRPPENVMLAYSSLRQLVERFPASEYAEDAEERIIAIRNRMAHYENYVADYYLRRGAYVAALKRATRAIEQYNGAPGNERSLEIMVEAYERLGMEDLAADTRRVLEANFPDRS